MKVLTWSCFLLAIYGAAAMSEDRKAELKQLSEVCRKENGVTDEDVQNLKASPPGAADVKDNIKCSIHCLMVKSHWMDEAGKFDAAAFKAAFPEEQGMKEALEKCQSMTGANPCETAFLISTCMFKHKMETVQ